VSCSLTSLPLHLVSHYSGFLHVIWDSHNMSVSGELGFIHGIHLNILRMNIPTGPGRSDIASHNLPL
jgi:hypothetical protein